MYSLWRAGPNSANAYLLQAVDILDQNRFGDFVAVMWEIWNERNRVIFGQRSLGKHRHSANRALQFVKNYREFREKGLPTLAPSTSWWKPPRTGIYKLNFDAGRIQDDWNDWGFVIRNHVGDVPLAVVKQNKGFSSPEEEEARACYYALRTTITYGFRQLIVEGDCQSLICKLHSNVVPNNSLGFFISDILSLARSFEFLVWSFVKKGCNSVAHTIAHLQPLTLHERIWVEEGPNIVYDLATKDMCTYIDNALM